MKSDQDRQQKVPISVLIPIKNEASNLPRCLESVNWADEIFVVDSQSIDGSQEIASRYGAEIVQFQLSAPWPKKKNWALDNLPFRNEWVFILDADEVMPIRAREEFAAVVSSERAGDGNSPVGYYINRRFFFMGKWLKHAYFPNWNLRLFKHRLGRYERLTLSDTASGDNEVHEHVVVTGPTGKLDSLMDHYAFPSIDAFVEKHNRYSNWEATVELDDQATQTDGVPTTWRRKFRQLSRRLPCRPFLRFLYVFVYQRGFLDGKEGFYFAVLHGYYEFLIVAKKAELKNRRG